jgi:hypothetical protein
MQAAIAMAVCANKGCTEQATRKYCSRECAVQDHNNKRAPVEKTKHNCILCGKVFYGRADAKTCGLNCRAKLHYQSKRGG